MRKRWITVAALLLGFACALLVVSFFRRSPLAPTASTSFIGFTNTPVRTEALIRFSDCNFDHVVFNLYDMDKMIQTGWKHENPPLVHTFYTNYSTQMPSSFVIGVPLPTSTNSWRLIYHFQERAPGSRGLLDRAEEFRERIFTRRVQLRYKGGVYFLTNECLQTIR